MAMYHYSLQPELDRRRAVEDAAQRDLAKVLRQSMILQTQLRAMWDSIRDERLALAGALVGSVDTPRLERQAAFGGQVQHRSGQLVARIAELEQQTSAARDRLAAAIKRRQAIERLHHKQYRRWRITDQRRKATELDDIATIAHVRHLLGLAAE